MTILSTPDPDVSAERLNPLPRIPREQGHFTWKEWAEALAAEIRAAQDRGEPDDGTHYYEHWLATLEHLVTVKALSNPNEMLARKKAWADAYRHTPHGKPVELASAKGAASESHRRTP